MRLWKRLLGVVLLPCMMAAFGGRTAEAKYLASQVTIDGPILHNPVVIDEEAEINHFVGGFFVVPSEDLVASVRPGHLFLLTAYAQDDAGSQIPIDRVAVSLDAATQSAQLYRFGMVNGWATQDGHWYQVDPAAVSLLKEALREAGVNFDPQGAILGLPPLPAEPANAERPTPWWYVIGILLVGLGFLAGRWIGAGRRNTQTELRSDDETTG